MMIQNSKSLALLTAILALLIFTGTAMAQVSKDDPRVAEMQGSAPYKSFEKACKRGKCKWVNSERGICKDEKAANKANRRLKTVKRTIQSRFGASLAPAAYKPVLGKWVNVAFEAEKSPEEKEKEAQAIYLEAMQLKREKKFKEAKVLLEKLLKDYATTSLAIKASDALDELIKLAKKESKKKEIARLPKKLGVYAVRKNGEMIRFAPLHQVGKHFGSATSGGWLDWLPLYDIPSRKSKVVIDDIDYFIAYGELKEKDLFLDKAILSESKISPVGVVWPALFGWGNKDLRREKLKTDMYKIYMPSSNCHSMRSILDVEMYRGKKHQKLLAEGKEADFLIMTLISQRYSSPSVWGIWVTCTDEIRIRSQECVIPTCAGKEEARAYMSAEYEKQHGKKPKPYDDEFDWDKSHLRRVHKCGPKILSYHPSPKIRVPEKVTRKMISSLSEKITNSVECDNIPCDGDNAKACYYLGHKYYKGKGVSKDIPRAMEFLRKSCDGGHGPACNTISWKRCHGEGDCDSRALQDAHRAVELSPNSGKILGTLAYVLCKQDKKEEANDVYRRSCKAGHKPSCGKKCK